MPDSRPRRPDDNAPDSADAATTDPAPALVLSGARLVDGRAVDVRLSGSRIEAVGTAGSLTSRGPRIDLRGYLLLPAPAEPHAHGDTALTADGDGPGPASHRAEDIQRRATEAALLQLGHGATALRAHVRIGDVQGLAALEAVLQARRALRGLADLTAVAVPRLLTGVAGAEGLALLRDAVKMGAAVVGGCPDLDPDPTGYTAAVLEVAAEHGCPVDLHTDGDDPARLARLAAMAGGLRPGVALGPCAGLAHLPLETAGRAADQLAAAGITVVCLPQGGCTGSERRTTAPVRLLRSAGVRVAAGSGALRDTANPVGRGDPLEAAYLLASQHGLRAEQAYAMVSTTARAALGLPDVRVEAGFPAELLAVRGERLSAALSLAYSRIVIHRGRVVARTSAVREYCDSEPDPAAGPDLPRQGRPDSGGGPGS
ncbi:MULTISPECIES: amidohydrolase family protein [Streptomyces]|uniref:amidohydrolase family protein n=1 Tax=Streptomyces TaxID=1883 RepID=UPI0010392F9C|nr:MULTISPECIES: amidohydrolase family protein [Streptomyces]MBT3076228.1 amidohydrolase family protein [Streptomyces sp. COG21]MBT3079260.1 amidohydrolase family protein [Streptomyces sp. COG20]MBT3086163.1 amidohydrolase family protein [Streptomyces sp. CYG21]MBT3095096.1 amidohydrolase family protein [Streptomyces sp. CBG30]MBT3106874.1 amidohydrolase family protein [Streptomyces sp. COG19]